MYLGDYKKGQAVYIIWATCDASGGAGDRSAQGTIEVYKDDNTTEDTSSAADTITYDTETGLNLCKIDTTGSFYAPGHDYAAVLIQATIASQTVTTPLAHFSIENRFSAPSNRYLFRNS